MQPLRWTSRGTWLAWLLMGSFACLGGSQRGTESGAGAVVGLRRLTVAQYQSTIADLFGPSIVPNLAGVKDLLVDGSSAAGAGQVGMPSVDAEAFTQAADDVSRQVLASLQGNLACSPNEAPDASCRQQRIASLGRQLYRRPLTSRQQTALEQLATARADASGDGWQGLQASLAAMLQSPYFLYRLDALAGEGDATALDAYSLATRLSYLIWNSTPDAELAAAADNGSLLAPEVLAAEANRLLMSPKADDGLMPFFVDLFRLGMINTAQKNPNDWPAALQDELTQQAYLTIRDQLLTTDSDYRSLFTTQTTFVNADLASRYGYPAPPDGNFVKEPVNLNDRAGLLGLPGIQAMLSFSARTSPTKRGLYVRSALLCTDVPSPPATVNTSVVADANVPQTMRQLMSSHAQSQECSACHALMDPIGFGLEDFDWLGNYRTSDHGLPLDLSGSVDEQPFVNSRTLGQALAGDPSLTACLVQRFLLAATASQASEQPALYAAMQRSFAAADYRFKELVLAYVTSSAFAHAP